MSVTDRLDIPIRWREQNKYGIYYWSDYSGIANIVEVQFLFGVCSGVGTVRSGFRFGFQISFFVGRLIGVSLSLSW